MISAKSIRQEVFSKPLMFDGREVTFSLNLLFSICCFQMQYIIERGPKESRTVREYIVFELA